MAVDDIPSFIYSPLNLEEQEIRLLEILPDSSVAQNVSHSLRLKQIVNRVLGGTVKTKGSLKCRLVSFDLRTCLEFRALSYKWGTSPASISIQVNSLDFYIRPHLFSFFEQVHGSCEGFLWIDAICIDQTNVSERNHQVQLMGEVYSRASEVLIWLGDAVGDSDLAMDFMLNTSSRHSGCPILNRQTADRGDYGAMSCELDPCHWRMEFSEALLQLCSRGYWCRVWILQEVMLAQELTMICGSKRLPSSIFFQYIRSPIIEGNHHPQSKDIRLSKARGVMIMKRMFDLGRRTTLAEALAIYTRFEATDGRDNVYGLLQLVDPAYRIAVDYSYTTEQLYFKLLAHIIKAESHLIYKHHWELAHVHLREKLGLPRDTYRRIDEEFGEQVAKLRS
jgi:hypothetical protein